MAHDHARGIADRRKLRLVIALVGTILVVEIAGGILTGSLSLLADAGHMFSDLTGLLIAFVAIGIAARPASDRHTWGFQRTEVLAALLNGLILSAVAVSVAVEGVRRLVRPEPVEVDGGWMLAVALVGLIANGISLAALHGSSKSSLNIKGAYLEVFGDLIGSVFVAAAAVVILLTGFVQADAIASLMIAAGILPRAVLLLRDVWRVLNESTPVGIDVELLRAHVRDTEGVVDVHDVHVWMITSGESVFTAHVIAEAAVFRENRVGELLDTLNACLADHFDVEHSTFQLEPEQHAGHEDAHHA